MKLNETFSPMDRNERNKININWSILERTQVQNLNRMKEIENTALKNLTQFKNETALNFINARKYVDVFKAQTLADFGSTRKAIERAQSTANDALALHQSTLATARNAVKIADSAVATANNALATARRAENGSVNAEKKAQEALKQSQTTAQQLAAIILESETSDAETVTARTNTATGITYASLLERLQADFMQFFDPFQMRQHLRNVTQIDIDGGLVYRDRTGYQFDGGHIKQTRNPNLDGGHVYARFN